MPQSAGPEECKGASVLESKPLNAQLLANRPFSEPNHILHMNFFSSVCACIVFPLLLCKIKFAVAKILLPQSYTE